MTENKFIKILEQQLQEEQEKNKVWMKKYIKLSEKLQEAEEKIKEAYRQGYDSFSKN